MLSEMVADEFIEKVISLANDIGCEVWARENSRKIQFNMLKPHMFHVTLELSEGSICVFYVTFRTNSYEFDGERTDLHDALSLLFAYFMRLNNVSVALWDVENPVLKIPVELYARHATLVQPNYSVITLDAQGLDIVEKNLNLIKEFALFVYHIFKNSDEKRFYSWQDEETESQGNALNKIAKQLYKETENFQFNTRKSPDWFFYRNSDVGVSIIKSEWISEWLSSQVNGCKDESIINLSGLFVVGEHNKYFIENEAFAVLQKFSLKEKEDLLQAGGFYSCETHLFSIESKNIVFVHNACGIDAFNHEREIYKRNVLGNLSTLYPGKRFVWANNISPDLFENMVRDILAREPGVTWVRRVSPTFQPDGGKDIVCEWLIKSNQSERSLDKSPLALKKILVECKAFNKTVGKDAISGIYEKMLHGDFDGVLLAVSTQTSTFVHELMSKIRGSGRYWADWWTRDEIEEKLWHHSDLREKYKLIVDVTYDD